MSQMTLLTGPERRRRWSPDEQQRIVAAAFSPGAIVADVSRQYEVSTSLIYKWRRQALKAESPSGEAFAPAVVIDEPAPVLPRPQMAAITIELAGGARVAISATAPLALVAATLQALR